MDKLRRQSMCKKWVVSLGYSAKIAFDDFKQAAAFLEMVENAQPVDTDYINGHNKTFAHPDNDMNPTIRRLEFLTADQYNGARLEAA